MMKLTLIYWLERAERRRCDYCDCLKVFGWRFQAKLIPQNQAEFDRCLKMGITNPDKTLTMDEIVKTDDCFFVATGITDGSVVEGYEKGKQGSLLTHSLVIAGGNMKNIQFVDGCFSADSQF